MANERRLISRRNFVKKSLIGTALLAYTSSIKKATAQTIRLPLRLGGPTFEKFDSPDSWVQVVNKLGYRAAYCPVGPKESDDVVKAYATAARKANIIIAEVGAWSNPLSPDEKTRKAALAKCRQRLALAERIGANCCVNVSGSRSREHWYGPHPDNLTKETFDMIVQATRAIIDDVNPTRTYFTLETMPWVYPDSTGSYVRLVKAIDRKRFAVHFDPVNLISSPQRYFNNAKLIRQFFKRLGPHIKSCHAKDVLLQPKVTTHLDEVRPGLGNLDYAVLLTELSKFPDAPLMIEHLKGAEEYAKAANHIRSVAQKLGLSFALLP
ncbi:MAG: sugar phosphate isomerase/epimerase family protein [Planctomycetota bacterium]|jgi:sugar phosphate isomerase/epimerase